MQLPSKINWKRLFGIAQRHGYSKQYISDETGVSIQGMYAWCKGTEPGLRLAAKVFNYLCLVLPKRDVERCMYFTYV